MHGIQKNFFIGIDRPGNIRHEIKKRGRLFPKTTPTFSGKMGVEPGSGGINMETEIHNTAGRLTIFLLEGLTLYPI